MDLEPGLYRLVTYDGQLLDRTVEVVSGLDEGDYLISRMDDGSAESYPVGKLDALIDGDGNVYQVHGSRMKDATAMTDDELAVRYQSHLDKFPYGAPLRDGGTSDAVVSRAAAALAAQVNTGRTRTRRNRSTAADSTDSTVNTVDDANGSTSPEDPSVSS